MIKKLNRRKLRLKILNEVKQLISEAEAKKETAEEAFVKMFKKQEAHYKSIGEREGIIKMAFSMIIGLPVEGMIAAAELLSDEKFRSDLESKYEKEGIEQAYVFWINSLSKETGL